ncbi:MAG: spondin domain-containing protein, partial [Pseudomonadales bacterium]
MKKLILTSAAVLIVSACSGGSDGGNAFAPAPTPEPPAPPPANAMFDISVTNLTAAQPFSPVAVLITEAGNPAFVVGEAASTGLEMLAESGDNSQLLADMNSISETSGESPLAPGADATFTLELDSSDPSGTELTVLTMLVNTNDAITGVQGVNIGDLAVDGTMMMTGISYDSGTEANDELAANIPGPAGGGE